MRAARARSEQAAALLERRRGLPAAPGDLFVLPATSEVPVEWAILERRTGSGDLLAVPADGHPLVGSADLAVEPDGTPVLRCRYPVWFEAHLFDPKHRSGVLPAEVVAAALRKVRQLETGEPDFSPLGEEVDRDPEYADWLREVPERARSLAAGIRTARPPDVIPTERRWWPVAAQGLAATLAVVSLGLGVWVQQLRHEVEALTAPAFNLEPAEVKLGAVDRATGRTEVSFLPGAKRRRLVLIVNASILDRARYLEIATAKGEVLKRIPLDGLKDPGEVHQDFLRRQLPDGQYRIRVFPEGGFTAPELYEETLVVRTKDSSSS
jgi:hypothetical protein